MIADKLLKKSLKKEILGGEIPTNSRKSKIGKS
jgi:hypothetical protein